MSALVRARDGLDRRRTAAPSPGGLFLFSIVYQVLLVKADALPAETYPALAAWYASTLADATTQRVISGESSHGPFNQYFLADDAA